MLDLRMRYGCILVTCYSWFYVWQVRSCWVKPCEFSLQPSGPSFFIASVTWLFHGLRTASENGERCSPSCQQRLWCTFHYGGTLALKSTDFSTHVQYYRAQIKRQTINFDLAGSSRSRLGGWSLREEQWRRRLSCEPLRVKIKCRRRPWSLKNLR